MRIVLSTPPADASKWGMGGAPPVGLGYLVASVKDLPNVDVKVLDAAAEGLDTDQAVQRILALSPDVFGVTITSLDVERNRGLLIKVKGALPEVTTIAGGYQATAFDALFLKEIPQLDLVLRGEADLSFPEFVERLLHGSSIEGVPGLSYRRDGDIVSGQPQFIEDLDALPFPDRHASGFTGYFRRWAGFTLPELPRPAVVISSRGCPNPCTFCSKLTPGSRKYRMRSVENVFEEVLQLSREGYEIVGFADENFSANADRVTRLCQMILDHGLTTRFLFQGTLFNLSQPLLDLMHRAGFDIALVGVESGSSEQLERYRKPADAERLGAGIIRAKKAHMFTVCFFMHGAPGETLEDCEASKRFVREVRPHACSTTTLMLLPGSKLWEELVAPHLVEDSLAATKKRAISDIPGQLSQEEIEARIADFRSAMASSWLDWRRIPEVIDLLRYNRTLSQALLSIFKNPRAVWRLIFSGKAPLIPQNLLREQSH